MTTMKEKKALVIVRQLAKIDPDEEYSRYIVCKFCDSGDIGDEIHHESNCVWLRAKRLIKDVE